MSYLSIQRLAAIRREYLAVHFAADYVERTWQSLSEAERPADVRRVQVRAALRGLEDTYLLRLFAEFEDVLQDHLASVQPQRVAPRRAEHLINRVASFHHITPTARDGAHQVRVYRNSIAHRQPESGLSVPFANSLALLNRFLAWLPNQP